MDPGPQIKTTTTPTLTLTPATPTLTLTPATPTQSIPTSSPSDSPSPSPSEETKTATVPPPPPSDDPSPSPSDEPSPSPPDSPSPSPSDNPSPSPSSPCGGAASTDSSDFGTAGCSFQASLPPNTPCSTIDSHSACLKSSCENIHGIGQCVAEYAEIYFVCDNNQCRQKGKWVPIPKNVTTKNLTINWLPDPNNAETNGGSATFEMGEGEGNNFVGQGWVPQE